MSPLLLAAVGAGAYLVLRKSAGMSKAEVEAEKEAVEQKEDAFIQKLAQSEDINALDPLQVTITLRVSGAEKLAISMGAMGGVNGLKAKAYTIAKDIESILPAECPGAPELIPGSGIFSGQPSLTMVESKTGYVIYIRWVARWKHSRLGPVKEIVRNCLLRLVKREKDLGPRITAFSVERMAQQ